jgi:ribosome-associated protein
LEGCPLSADAPRKSRKTATAAETADDAVRRISSAVLGRLDDDKAEDVVVIDLQGQSPLADTLIIASGRSQRHVSALADHVVRALKEAGFGKAQVEGLPQADWVLIDAGDVIVHLFRPEVRAFYQLEKIWSLDAPHRTPAPAPR